jgi:hypothetical protein
VRRADTSGEAERAPAGPIAPPVASPPLDHPDRVRNLAMLRRVILAFSAAIALAACFASDAGAEERGFGRSWGSVHRANDWERFYHYPYVFYPQNFYSGDYYQSSESLYFRYPPEMRVPVYNLHWQNDYPQSRRYYSGHHFHLDVF